MKKHAICWTVLPESSASDTESGVELHISIFVSPRLWDTDPEMSCLELEAFPAWLDWPSIIEESQFFVEFSDGQVFEATRTANELRSDLWRALFQPTTKVKPFVFEDLSDVEIVSFPAKEVFEVIKKIFQDIAIDSSEDLPDCSSLIDNNENFRAIAREVTPEEPWEPEELEQEPSIDEDSTEGCLGCLLWPILLVRWLIQGLKELLQWVFQGFGINLFASPVSPSPSTIPTVITSSDQDVVDSGSTIISAASMSGESSPPLPPVPQLSPQRSAFDAVSQFIQPFEGSQLPSSEEIEDEYDFHRMISVLGDYPKLMRALGLVIDLVIIPDTTVSLPSEGTVKVSPRISSSLLEDTLYFCPKTHYQLDNSRFIAKPNPDGSKISNGLLCFNNTDNFQVIQPELVGSAIKLQNAATDLAGMIRLDIWPANAPEDVGIPSLETAGISVIRVDQVKTLKRRFIKNKILNNALAKFDSSILSLPQLTESEDDLQPSDELYADDLIRGYRIDIWDNRSNRWHSLCQRLGKYEFFPDDSYAKITLNESDQEILDEGFVQLVGTESPAESSDKMAKLHVHESLFTWNGWSLVASRPGLTILDADDDASVGSLKNEPCTPFKLVTTFRPLPRSLPRLRFGWNYKVRARVVDLAGNSPFNPNDSEFDKTQAEVTPEFQFDRYEPVSPPSIMLRRELIEGESLERLVVRSNINDESDASDIEKTERHIIPPKIAQLMAEYLGSFDNSSSLPEATYNLASREAGTLIERLNLETGKLELMPGIEKKSAPDDLEDSNGTYWIQTAERFEVSFLPDNLSRGVAFANLPGSSSGISFTKPVKKIEFSGQWPDLEAFRLQLKGIKAGTTPQPPMWDNDERILTVELAQGEIQKVRYSSYTEGTNLELMAIGQWVKQVPSLTPQKLEALTQSTLAGQNWLQFPYRELTLVHAVKRPLKIPEITRITADQGSTKADQGSTKVKTQVSLDIDIKIDAKSTGEIDFDAVWKDPFDDLKKDIYDPENSVINQKMHITEFTVNDRNKDNFEVRKVNHAIGDTKYHKVTYIATGTSYFREYFAQGNSNNISGDVFSRPTDEESDTCENKFVVEILNSARPSTVDFLYAVPIFSWEQTSQSDEIRRTRKGGGLRVFVARPWFSSGEGELLGVVLCPQKNRKAKSLEKYVSEWGMDPLLESASTKPLHRDDFASPVEVETQLTLEELDGSSRVDIVGFEPHYDSARNRWFFDIVLNAEKLYFPFVRLALARYQPNSLENAHLSNVVLSDFCQVLPTRTVSYRFVKSSKIISITASGSSAHRTIETIGRTLSLDAPTFLTYLERRSFQSPDELGWEVIPETLSLLTKGDSWQGEIALSNLSSDELGKMRIVVIEAEVYDSGVGRDDIKQYFLTHFIPNSKPGALSDTIDLSSLGYRFVYVDTLELKNTGWSL